MTENVSVVVVSAVRSISTSVAAGRVHPATVIAAKANEACVNRVPMVFASREPA